MNTDLENYLNLCKEKFLHNNTHSWILKVGGGLYSVILNKVSNKVQVLIGIILSPINERIGNFSTNGFQKI